MMNHNCELCARFSRPVLCRMLFSASTDDLEEVERCRVRISIVLGEPSQPVS